MTRRERVDARRKELLADWDYRFKLELDKEISAVEFDYKRAFQNAIRTLDRHLQGLIAAKPQEKGFILSCTREWQRLKIEQMNAVLSK